MPNIMDSPIATATTLSSYDKIIQPPLSPFSEHLKLGSAFSPVRGESPTVFDAGILGSDQDQKHDLSSTSDDDIKNSKLEKKKNIPNMTARAQGQRKKQYITDISVVNKFNEALRKVSNPICLYFPHTYGKLFMYTLSNAVITESFPREQYVPGKETKMAPMNGTLHKLVPYVFWINEILRFNGPNLISSTGKHKEVHIVIIGFGPNKFMDKLTSVYCGVRFHIYPNNKMFLNAIQSDPDYIHFSHERDFVIMISDCDKNVDDKHHTYDTYLPYTVIKLMKESFQPDACILTMRPPYAEGKKNRVPFFNGIMTPQSYCDTSSSTIWIVRPHHYTVTGVDIQLCDKYQPYTNDKMSIDDYTSRTENIFYVDESDDTELLDLYDERCILYNSLIHEEQLYYFNTYMRHGCFNEVNSTQHVNDMTISPNSILREKIKESGRQILPSECPCYSCTLLRQTATSVAEFKSNASRETLIQIFGIVAVSKHRPLLTAAEITSYFLSNEEEKAHQVKFCGDVYITTLKRPWIMTRGNVVPLSTQECESTSRSAHIVLQSKQSLTTRGSNNDIHLRSE